MNIIINKIIFLFLLPVILNSCSQKIKLEEPLSLFYRDDDLVINMMVNQRKDIKKEDFLNVDNIYYGEIRYVRLSHASATPPFLLVNKKRYSIYEDDLIPKIPLLHSSMNKKNVIYIKNIYIPINKKEVDWNKTELSIKYYK